MPSKIEFVEAENDTREYPNAFVIEEAMFKVNGVYVCMEPCGGGDAKHLLGDQYVYVSSTGNDNSVEGLEEAPFLTIVGAMDYVNSFVTIGGDIFISFMDEGPFYINETVTINHQNKITFVGVVQSQWWGNTLVWFGGQDINGFSDLIQSVDSASATQTTSFGVLSTVSEGGESASDSTNGFYFSGYDGGNSTQTKIEKIVFASAGNSTYFGDLLSSVAYAHGCSNGTLAMHTCGEEYGGAETDTIEVFTMATEGNSVSHGTLGMSTCYHGTSSDGTTTVCAGGTDDNGDVIQMWSILFSTNTVGSYFGDLTVARSYLSGGGDKVLGIFPGGYDTASISVIDYVTIATTANSTDWGTILTYDTDSSAVTSDGTSLYIGGNYSPREDAIQSFLIVAGAACSDWGSLTTNIQLLTATSGN